MYDDQGESVSPLTGYSGELTLFQSDASLRGARTYSSPTLGYSPPSERPHLVVSKSQPQPAARIPPIISPPGSVTSTPSNGSVSSNLSQASVGPSVNDVVAMLQPVLKREKYELEIKGITLEVYDQLVVDMAGSEYASQWEKLRWAHCHHLLLFDY